ncbi:class I SAM-dependent methyltransferase [Nocardioides anomalus]|uniref:S-adenosyl-L-methionine-dependent methyltransferase n=1 Tax=Nocardioides anomalus TaxID=2712223 RepID=A0A6G6WAT6_9ACTN|nr:class I SAM-dependent methyltransferase [Nocardioides anomalus]QIG42150.1 class I SAM-dependent methyltransferase [Nocardioides anomalus]
MREGEPSRTAWGAAVHRAVHPLLDDPVLFDDPLALPLLGVDRETLLADAPPRSRLRVFVALRHRFADQTLAAAYERGTRQCVVLGAGLDTIAYRNPHEDLRVFEVDFPATQAWKRERLDEAGIDPVATYVGVDFERDSLLERLRAGGFDVGAPAVFVWLGVVPYLTREAVRATLSAVATVPGAEVVLDHPGTDRDAAGEERLRRLAERVAAVGEELTPAWAPGEMTALLREVGFTDVDELPLPPGSGAHIVRARRPA